MNKKTVALTEEIYKNIINALKNGFKLNNNTFRPNIRIATILTLEANLGLRIGDILRLKLNNFILDGDRYRLDIIETKTRKNHYFTVPIEIYRFIKLYVLEHQIPPTATIFPITDRCVQKHLKHVCDYLNVSGVSTHSFRKYFATQIYLQNDYNIRLINELLQHASLATTQRYIGIGSIEIEKALKNHIKLYL